MALDRSQRLIVNSLIDKPQTIRQLIVSTGLSDSTIRQNLRLLTKLHEVSMDKDRQPYMYEVGANSNTLLHRTEVSKAKRILMGEEDTQNPVVKALLKFPKESLRDFPVVLRNLAEAIEELDEDGQLIDTL